MTIPVWPLMVVGVFFYVAVGVAQAVLMSFLHGRGPKGSLDIDIVRGLLLAFVWPVVDVVLIGFWVASRYDDLLEAARKRGEQSAQNDRHGVDGP